MAPANTQRRRLGNLQVWFAARRLQQVVEHRRHAGEVGELAALEQSHRFAGRELFHDAGARAGCQDAEYRQVQRIGMKQRQRREQSVVLGEAGDRRPARGRDPQHPMHGEPHALGASGGARRVEDERRVVQRRGIARRRLRRSRGQVRVAQRGCAARAAIGDDQCAGIGRRGLQPRLQIATLGGRENRPAVRIGEPVGDFRFAQVIADGDADRASAGDREAAFDPGDGTGQHDRDGVVCGNAGVGKVSG